MTMNAERYRKYFRFMTTHLLTDNTTSVAIATTEQVVKCVDSEVAKVSRLANASIPDAMFGEKRERAVARREEAQRALDEYLAEQRELFRSKRLNPDRAYAEAIVPTGERLANGVDVYRIVPRGVSIAPVEDDDGLHANSVAGAKSYSDRMGISREQSRGKYNDAAMLIEQSSGSVDRSEVVPFACACA